MGTLPTPFQLTLVDDNDPGGNWDQVETWANTYPGIRLWGTTVNTDGSTGMAFPAVGQILLQAGTVTPTTDGSGTFTITFSKAFPNSLITCLVSNGDNTVSDITFGIVRTPARTGVSVQVWGTSGAVVTNTPIRAEWIAVGF